MVSRHFIIFCFLIFTIIFLGCVSLEEIEAPDTFDDPVNSEITDGFIRLVLHESTGSFSLSYIPNAFSSRYEPLFISKNPRSSYMSVSVDDKIYRLGRSKEFKTRIDRENGDPAIIFESDFLSITKIFTPIRTDSSQNANGIMLTLEIKNLTNEEIFVGLRFLLDTALGEKRGSIPFVTNRKSIENELVVSGYSGERYWMSQGEMVSLMGSITNPLDRNDIPPDYLHFANRRRLNNAPWNLQYREERSFSKFPFSVRDSAVCYFYEPVVMFKNSTLTYNIFLTTDDIAWYYPDGDDLINIYLIADNKIRVINVSAAEQIALLNAVRTNQSLDRQVLLRVQESLNQFIRGEITLTEQDLAEIERIINLHRN